MALKLFKCSNLQTIVGRIAFAVAVYCVWNKRNLRIFTGRCKTVNVIVMDVENYVRAKNL